MLFYRRDGSTFEDHEEFARILADIDYRRVAQTAGDGWSVSTVFLSLDHNFSGTGPPMVYETLATADDGSEDGFEAIDRYPNEVAALAGHDQWIETVRDLTSAGHATSSEGYPSAEQ